MKTFWPTLKRRVNLALYFGFFILVAGFFISESSTHHTQVYLGLYITALLAVALNARQLFADLCSDRAMQCFTALLVWLGITTVWTAFDNTLHLIKLLLMLWVLALALRLMLDNLRWFNITLGLCLGTTALVLVFSLWNYLHSTGMDFYQSRLDQLGRQEVPAVVVGKIAVVLCLASLALAHLAGRSWLRTLFLFMAGFFLLPLILSFSRTAFLALFLTITWYYLRRRNARATAGLATLTFLLAWLMVMDPGNAWLENISRSQTVEIRLWGWQATWREIIEHFWLGQGLRAPFVVDWAGTPYEATGMEFLHPHNLVLSVWYDAGLIGVLLFVLLLVMVVIKLQALRGGIAVAYCAYTLLFVMLACLADSPTLVDRPSGDWIWFWLPLMLAINADKFAGGRQKHTNAAGSDCPTQAP